MINSILKENIDSGLNFEEEAIKIEKLIKMNNDKDELILADSIQLILIVSKKEIISMETCLNIVKQIKNIK